MSQNLKGAREESAYVLDLIGNMLSFSNRFVNALVTALLFTVIFGGLIQAGIVQLDVKAIPMPAATAPAPAAP